MESLVKIKGLTFSYKGTNVKPLDNISVEIARGSIFGLVGKNGAGKTTLMQILFGNLQPATGEVEICGLRQKDLPRAKLGFIPERPYYHQHFRMKEYLSYLNKIATERRSDGEIDEIIRFVHMQDFAHEYIKSFSKGMLQRVGIAQALLNRPEFLILDEPMSGLDIVGQDLLRDVILKLNSQGTTILISSHNIYEIERLCTQIGILHNGRLQLISKEALQNNISYSLAIDGPEEKIREFVKFIAVPSLEVKNGKLTFPADDPELYFRVMRELTLKQLRITRLETTGPSLESFILRLLSERGGKHE